MISEERRGLKPQRGCTSAEHAATIATEPAKLAFQGGNRRPIELPVSLDGLTAAIEQATASSIRGPNSRACIYSGGWA